MSEIIPIYKKTNKVRPIIIRYHYCLIFLRYLKKAVFKRLRDYLDDNDVLVLDRAQHVFRSVQSVITTATDFVESIVSQFLKARKR